MASLPLKWRPQPLPPNAGRWRRAAIPGQTARAGHGAEALKWRLDTIEKARDRAGELGLAGAAFPWRTISGAETGAYWPAGTAAFHINADIAQAGARYCDINVDPDFEEQVALPLLVETARLWRSHSSLSSLCTMSR